MTQQKQLFGCNKSIVNVIKLDPTDILTPDDLFFIQKLIKLGIKTDEILNKFEYQDRQFVLDYIVRVKNDTRRTWVFKMYCRWWHNSKNLQTIESWRKNHEEIAEILGKDVSWISKNKNRLISKLKIILFSDDVLKEIFG